MQKLKVSEIFYSIQGEGRFMGVPSVFLRTFGCNFTCSGFGMPVGENSVERDLVAQNISRYTDYRDLPLVHTGCDSYASWDPRFKDLSPVLTTDSVAKAVTDQLPHRAWQDEHLVITGGEPLLGWQRAYPALLEHPLMQSCNNITFETNGTQDIGAELAQYLQSWRQRRARLGDSGEITFSVSAKLPCSGENWSDAIRPQVVRAYQDLGFTYLKFVVATEQDIEHARAADREFRDAGFTGPTYIMPLGGVESVYSLNNRRVAEWSMKLGWRYSDRLQVPLFKNAWGT
jgi:7-carboxy-7-deazaguanine synthase